MNRSERLKRAASRARTGPSTVVTKLIEALTKWGSKYPGWRSLLRWETVGRNRGRRRGAPGRKLAFRYLVTIQPFAVDRHDRAWKPLHRIRRMARPTPTL